MSFYDDDKSRASSDNEEEDEDMEDLAGGQADQSQELEAEVQNEEDNQDPGDDDEDQDEPDESPSRPTAHRQHSATTNGVPRRLGSLLRNGSYADNTSYASQKAASVSPAWPALRTDMIAALEYDIVPTIAAPQSTSINTVCATPDMRWVFTGGSDGWIRKFHWIDTVNGKSQLTVAQRHPFVDSVQKAGILQSYWENEETSTRLNLARQNSENANRSSVYSLAVQRDALWLLSGTESGAINVQTVRHDEGKRITTLQKHTSAVSVMSLDRDEQSLLSGSWDKTINDWDMNTGQPKRSFSGSASQIAAIEIRPLSDVPIPRDFAEPAVPSETFKSDSNDRRKSRASVGTGGPSRRQSTMGGFGASPTDSLFGGGADSLFGDNDLGGGDASAAMGLDQDEDDKDYSKAFTDTLEQEEAQEQQQQVDGTFDLDMNGGLTLPTSSPKPMEDATTATLTNGVGPSTPPPHAEDLERAPQDPRELVDDQPMTSETVFLDASIDGMLRVWDRRQQSPVARMLPPRGTPPWCMHACWSQDGNAIYAGRRNGTVDEYSFHKGLREPSRTLTFPSNSGPVSALRPMPNGKHLVCASYDILRLYDLKVEENSKKTIVPFQIVPGHRTGMVSQLFLDPTCSFMISAGGHRGWEGNNTEALLGYEINVP